MNIITEELLYRNLMKQHKSFMFSLLIFHFILLLITAMKILINPKIHEDNYFCKNSLEIRNIAFIILNIPLFIFSYQSFSRNTALLSNISFYQKSQSIMFLGILSSFIILFYKFLPDYVCPLASISMEGCAMMFL